jgi:hypothetical protein
MSKIKSLQYLLLDTLNKRKNIRNKHLSINIAKTLRVNVNKNDYEISWVENFKQKKIFAPKEDFSFYIKNDIPIKKDNIENSLEKNNNNAKKIINQILNEKEILSKPLNFFRRHLIQISILLISFIPLIFFSTIENKIIVLSIIMILIFDVINKSFFINIYFLLISIIKPNEFVFFYCTFLLLFTIFEPGIKFKKIKILLIFTAIIINFYLLDIKINFSDFNIFLISLLMIFITINNFTRYNSNFNWLYCIPSFALGFMMNENIVASYITLLICCSLTYIFNYLDKTIFFKIKTSPILE